MNIQISKKHHDLLKNLKNLTSLSIQAVTEIAIEVLFENKSYIPEHLKRNLKEVKNGKTNL